MQFCRKWRIRVWCFPQEAIDRARAELGLDKPFLTQYFVWLGNLLQGRYGNQLYIGKRGFSHLSFKTAGNVTAYPGFPFLPTIVISIPLGVLAAVKQNRFTDYLIRAGKLSGEQYAEFFCGVTFNVFSGNQAQCIPGYFHRGEYPKRSPSSLTLAIAMLQNI